MSKHGWLEGQNVIVEDIIDHYKVHLRLHFLETFMEILLTLFIPDFLILQKFIKPFCINYDSFIHVYYLSPIFCGVGLSNFETSSSGCIFDMVLWALFIMFKAFFRLEAFSWCKQNHQLSSPPINNYQWRKTRNSVWHFLWTINVSWEKAYLAVIIFTFYLITNISFDYNRIASLIHIMVNPGYNSFSNIWLNKTKRKEKGFTNHWFQLIMRSSYVVRTITNLSFSLRIIFLPKRKIPSQLFFFCFYWNNT